MLTQLALVLGEQLLLQVPFVVPWVAGYSCARRDLDDPVHEIVEEVAVVGDEQERPGELVELLLEPVHGVGVEVVRGLVEQEQVRPGQERAGDRDPLPRSARQIRYGAVPLLHPEPVEEPPRLVRGVPAAEVLDALRQHRELGEEPLVGGLVPRGLEPRCRRRVRVERRPERRARHLELGRDAGTLGEGRLLRQIGHRGAAAELDLAPIRLGDARQHLHERGLARAVDADQAEPLPFLDRERQLLEDGSAAE